MRFSTIGLGVALMLAPAIVTAQTARGGATVSFEQGNADKASLQEAFETAFATQIKPGQPVKFARASGDEGVITFEPVALYRIRGDLYALLSTGSAEEQGHASSGTNAVHYLRSAEGGWQKTGEWFGLGSTGTWGNGATEWKFTRGLGKNPYLLTSGGGTWQGCSLSQTILTELAPDAPKDRGSFTDHNSWSEESMGKNFSYNGTISTPVADRSFTLSYKGTKNLRQQFVRQGEDYKRIGPDEIPGC